jgi:hypothetical protein
VPPTFPFFFANRLEHRPELVLIDQLLHFVEHRVRVGLDFGVAAVEGGLSAF